MNASSHCGRHAAFTLIELLVSVAVGSYLISMAAVCISMSLKASKNANTVAAQAKAGSNMMEWLWSNRTTAQWTVNTSLNGISAYRAAAQQISFATGAVYGTNYSTGSFYHQSAIASVPTYKISSVESFSGSAGIDPGRVVNAQEDTPFQDGQYVFIYSAGTNPYQLFTQLPSPTSAAPNNKSRINARTTRICDNATVPTWSGPVLTAGATWRIGYATHFPLPVPSIKVQRP